MSKPYESFEVFGLPLAFEAMGAMHALQVCQQLSETPDTRRAVIYALGTSALKEGWRKAGEKHNDTGSGF